MPIIEAVFSVLTAHHLIAVFVGSFFFGETIIISAFYLAFQLQWSLWQVYAVTLLGTIASDSLWYLFGRYSTSRAKIWAETHQKQRLLAGLKYLSQRRPILTLLYIKFLYGTRIVMILYISWLKIPYRIFLLYNTLGTAIWLYVMMLIGYLVSRGITNLIPTYSRFQALVTALIVLLLILKISSKWLARSLTTK